ncbi:hypothetical protein O181_079406 [Austropuccinia psidii MF-1]|uniref:Uncharacterized protein n=1 Tax=Austropuccinia psidii MF-1 TaxID=1389203 RepID=A0A9Q3FLT2_9BASI|nr:hypothetical protein [Austropuccinia psidii MF-1]
MSGGCQSFPHSTRYVPTTFDVNSENEMFQGNISRDEPFPSGSHRNTSVPLQKLVQSSQGRGVGNMPKPLAGGHELLLTDQDISGPGEDHRNLRRVEPIGLQRQGKRDNELVEEATSFIHRPEEGVGNDPSFGERRTSAVYRRQKCPKKNPRDLIESRKVPRTIKAREKENPIGTDLAPKGTESPNWSLQLWTVFLHMARTLIKFTAKEKGMMKRTFPRK